VQQEEDTKFKWSFQDEMARTERELGLWNGGNTSIYSYLSAFNKAFQNGYKSDFTQFMRDVDKQASNSDFNGQLTFSYTTQKKSTAKFGKERIGNLEFEFTEFIVYPTVKHTFTINLWNGDINSLIIGRFPFDERVGSYLVYPGRFGDSRDGGSRKHGGADLYAPVGTNVYAVKGGTVIQNPYKFYRGSYAIEVNHGSFIARYSEINVASELRAGSIITLGQLIGTVANLSLNKSMLHFEMYSGSATGPLTNRDNLPYMRRSDLIDPTHFLNFGY